MDAAEAVAENGAEMTDAEKVEAVEEKKAEEAEAFRETEETAGDSAELPRTEAEKGRGRGCQGAETSEVEKPRKRRPTSRASNRSTGNFGCAARPPAANAGRGSIVLYRRSRLRAASLRSLPVGGDLGRPLPQAWYDSRRGSVTAKQRASNQ